MGDEGAIAIVRYLGELQKLVVIKCRIGHEGIASIAQLSNLKELSVTNNLLCRSITVNLLYRNLSRTKITS
jgi:hypothetical protein